MDTRPLVLIADKGLKRQSLIGDLLSEDAQVTSIIRKSQLDTWLQDINVIPSLLLLNYDFLLDKTRDFCQVWLAHPMMRNVPIIIMGEADERIELLALTSGAIDYIAEPFGRPMLTRARLKLHLRQVQELRRLSSLSMTDGLTNIANRRYFDEFYSAEWRRACREKGNMGLIMIDVDHFKSFNDHYGHLEGDKCLTKLAQQLKSVVQRPRDFVARFGGEEFIVLLPSIQPEGLLVVAERLKQALDSLSIPHEYSNAGNIVTVSMGLAWCEPDSSYLPDQLIAAADEALYSAKDAGRDCRSEVVIVENQLVF
ncbi:MAG: diguanylate cyclase response regulator [Oleispira sp.]|nr:diguanylate cyclase response regulator [Oleispira sp.]